MITDISSKEQINAGIQIVLAISEAIKTLGSVPNGELYARVMDKISLESYNKVIKILVDSGIVENKNNLLIWRAK